MIDPNILASPRLKVERANSHIEELRRLTQPLAHEFYAIDWTVETDPSMFAYPDPYGVVEYRMDYRPIEPIPQRLALIMGDVLHNLRGALDHLATGIANGSPWKAANQVHFPMRENRESLISSTGEPIDSLAAIEVALPGSVHLLLDEIRPKNGESERLWSFHTLNNDDKHNLLIPTVAVTVVRLPGGKVGSNVYSELRMEVDAAHPAGLLVTDQPITIEGDIDTFVDVKFGEGSPFQYDPVIPTLTQISNLVSGTINKFEGLINKTA